MASTSFAKGIPLIGLNRDGKQVSVSVSQSDFEKQMKEIATSVHESAMPALLQHSRGHYWMLRTLVIGVGLQLDAGLGPILSITTKPRFRLVYTNSSAPFFP